MEPVISVIVPVYNVESYLRKCIESICNQTLREIEIILVDDGSTDNCGKICDEYAALDSRVQVIHQENRGLSAARNAGIEIANGEFLSFVDSDDWIDPDMLEFLYNNLVMENADISVCGKYFHREDQIRISGNSNRFVQSNYDAIHGLFHIPEMGFCVWNKLYRKHLFDDIRFPEGRIFEDVFVIVRLFDTSKKVICHMMPKYHYLVRVDSISHRPYYTKSFDLIEAANENYNYLQKKHPGLANIAKQGCFNAYFKILFSQFLSHGTVDKTQERACIDFLKENRLAIWTSPLVSKKRKLLLLILCIQEPLCKLLVRMLKL